MQFKFYKRSIATAPIVFFTGWGMDAMPFESLLGQHDTLIVWDYTDLTTPLPWPTVPFHLIAWSMGVWVANQLVPMQQCLSATAINGTPFPIDETRGIPPAIFTGTLTRFSAITLKKFQRRMCGNEEIAAFQAHAPVRTLESLQQELRALSDTIGQQTIKPFKWTQAYASRDDHIFPFENQCRAFPKAVAVEGCHWSKPLFQQVLGGTIE